MAGSINISMDSVKMFLSQIDAYLRGLPQTIKNSPQDEQIAYYSVFAGMVFILLGFLLMLIL